MTSWIITWLLSSLILWIAWVLLVAAVPTTVRTSNAEVVRAAAGCLVLCGVLTAVAYFMFN